MRVLVLALLLGLRADSVEVTGSVVEHGSGTPLTGAHVVLRHVETGVATDAVTDDNGRFRMTADHQGASRIDVTKSGYARSVLFTNVEKDLCVVLRLVKGGVIAGRVTNEAGWPVPNIAIVLLRKLPGDVLQPVRESGAPPTTARTGADGSYRLFGLAPGTYAVAAVSSDVQSPGGGPVPRAASALRFASITASGESVSLDLDLSSVPAGSVEGRVEGAKPEDSVLVVLLPADLPFAPAARTLVAPDGSFRFTRIPYGSYTLMVAAPSRGSGGLAGILGPDPVFARTQVDVNRPDPVKITIRTEPARAVCFQLAGRAEKPDSVCAARGNLSLAPLEGWGAHVVHQAVVSSKVATTVRDLAPARYIVNVSGLREGCYTAGETVMDLNGNTADVVRIPVSRGPDFRGKILPVGAPRVLMVFWPGVDDSHDLGMMAIQANEAGEVAADSIPPGQYRLLAVRDEDWSNARWLPDFTGAVEMELRAGIAGAEIWLPSKL